MAFNNSCTVNEKMVAGICSQQIQLLTVARSQCEAIPSQASFPNNNLNLICSGLLADNLAEHIGVDFNSYTV